MMNDLEQLAGHNALIPAWVAAAGRRQGVQILNTPEHGSRCTVLFDTPATPAIVLVLQCVSPSGRYSLVSVTIFSIVASGIEDLRPRPSRTCPNLTRPSSVNRVRQFATVLRDTD